MLHQFGNLCYHMEKICEMGGCLGGIKCLGGKCLGVGKCRRGGGDQCRGPKNQFSFSLIRKT